MPSASGPPSSTRSPTGAPVASSATVAATSSTATSLHQPVREPDAAALRPRLGDLGQELEELRGAQDGVRNRAGFDLALLGDLRAQVAAVGEAVGADDRQREMVADAGVALGRQQVSREVVKNF